MNKYGVAFHDGWHNMRHHKNAYPQVMTCSSKENAVEAAKRMGGGAVPFENLEERTEVNWQYIDEHEIKETIAN